MQDQLQTEGQEKTPTKRSKETVSDLVHRHLNDQHHEITDEEIRNVDLQLDNTLPAEAVNSEVEAEEKLVRKAESAKADSEAPRITTPADILGS